MAKGIQHVQKSGKHVAHHPRDFFWCHHYNATVTARRRRPHGKHCATWNVVLLTWYRDCITAMDGPGYESRYGRVICVS
jgi:hypothetical protein